VGEGKREDAFFFYCESVQSPYQILRCFFFLPLLLSAFKQKKSKEKRYVEEGGRERDKSPEGGEGEQTTSR